MDRNNVSIGILTHFGTSDNYGQVLQCFALQSYLIKLGYASFLIRYTPATEDKERLRLVRQAMRLILSVISSERRKIYKEIRYYKRLRIINNKKNELRQFRQFVRENINITPVYYSSYEDLKRNPPKADAYIVGSDQVWNLKLSNPAAAAWYLQFGDKNIVRISYAASIGRDIETNEIKRFYEYLSDFNAISVREISTLNLCHNIGLNQCQLVLDPTLLLTLHDYKNFVDKQTPCERPYLFLYYLNITSSEELNWPQLKHYVASESLILRSVASSGYYPAQDLIPGHDNEYLTIPKWLTAIYHSKCVVSNSFHGIAFSIIMHKPFVAILLNNQYKGGNSRIVSLLETLNLTNRILNDSNSFESIFDTPINWEYADKQLSKERSISHNFISSALNQIRLNQ